MNLDKEMFCYEYARPALTVDIVVYTYIDDKLKVLLIERGIEPFKGHWALPGGFVNENENVQQAIERELFEETNLKLSNPKQFYFASEPRRDPRGWTVSSVFIGYIGKLRSSAKAGDDARDINWFSLSDLPKLAFDHHLIIEKSKMILKEISCHSILNIELLPSIFKVSEIINLLKDIGNTSTQAEEIVERLIKFGAYSKVENDIYIIDKEIHLYIEEKGFEKKLLK